jgi:hypothetical protein
MIHTFEYKEVGKMERNVTLCSHVTYLVAMTSSGNMTNHSTTSTPEPEDVFLLRIAAILSPEITEITKPEGNKNSRDRNMDDKALTKTAETETWMTKH